MIYLFDRLYLESDHYIRNDKKKMTALLGESAVEAKSCDTLHLDFGKIQLDEYVPNQELAQYLTGLVAAAEGQRVVVYTNDATLIKILAFYCSSVFENATPEFVKSLIMIDKLWIDLGPGVAGHRDFSLRHKGIDSLDITGIDQLIIEGMSITPKLTGYSELRMEYVFAAYLNGTLNAQQKQDFEQKMKDIFCKQAWFGDLVKTFGPAMLTLAHKRGADLDLISTESLQQMFPNYFKIFDTSTRGDATCFDRVTQQDCLNFLEQSNEDFGWEYPQSLKDLVTNFYASQNQFVKDKILTPENISEYFGAMQLGMMIKANPYLWYSIGSPNIDAGYLNKFKLNV